jgi:NAD dependent epimerase/dehydratase family enzyme
VPPLALRFAFGELAEMLLLGQRVVPARALAEGFTFRFPQIDTALADLLGRTS